MRPWYRYHAKYDDYPQRTVITPLSRLWGYAAPVTIALLIVNTSIWLLMVVTGAAGWLPLADWWYKYFALTPDYVLRRGWVWQLLTSVFLHDGSQFLHLGVNMYLLWVFGPRVERRFGSRLFLCFYLATGVAGSLLSLIMRTVTGYSGIPSLGASSAVFGMLTAYGFLFSNDILLLFFVIPMRAWVTVAFFVVLETLFILLGWMQQVDHYAHLGGAAAAALWMVILLKIRGAEPANGWMHPERPRAFRRRLTADRYDTPREGFFVISGTASPDEKGHPEGTDDEPPPEWFRL